MTAADIPLKASCCDTKLGRDALRRLLIGFILREQKALNKKGLIQRDQALAGQIIGKSDAQIDAVDINEDALGFDSLGKLELITALNQFFGLHASGVEDYFLIRRRIGDWIDLLAHHLDCVGDTLAFGFQTSGSTGHPKLIHHSAKDLWAEMRTQTKTAFAHIKAPGRVITLVPPHHIYGFLFGSVLADVQGLKVVDLHYAAPGAAFRCARAGDLIVGTPFSWDLLGKTGLAFCDDVYGVTSGGPSNAATWDVTCVNNLAGMTEIYGSTETAGIGSRTSEGSPFTLLPHLESADGVIRRKNSRAPLEVQDKLTWRSTTTFHVSGRLDAVVQVAGVNVCPNLVREQLLQLEGVADAAVRLGSDRLRAFVVAAPDVDEAALKPRLQAHVIASLDPPARPGSFTFGKRVPCNAMGKPTDWD